MSNEVCLSCRRPTADLECEICYEPVCRNCIQFLEAGSFSFETQLSEDLSHSYYCQHCYTEKVEPAQELYQQRIKEAKNAYFFFDTQKRQVPLLKKSKERVKVEHCTDRDETILRLAYQAIAQGYNAIIEGNVTAEKVRNEGYQKSNWKGDGIPAQLDVERFERRNRDY